MPDDAPTIMQNMLCQLAKKSRGDKVVQSWARKHAPSGTVRERVQCLLDALAPLEREIEPASETLMHPGFMLTRNIRGDVDDVAITLAAACESLGLETKIVMVRTTHGDFASYTVHLHVKDEQGDWLPFDPDSLSPIQA